MTDNPAVANNDMAGESPQNRRVVKLVLHILLIAVSIVMLYPLLWMLASSFRTNGEILNNLSIIPESLSPRNYIAGWNALRFSFGTFAWNSLVIAILTVVGNVMSCSITAFAFARLNFRGRKFWFAIMLQLLFAMQLEWLPLRGRLGDGIVPPPDLTGSLILDSLRAGRWDALWDALRHLVLPAVTLSLG